MAHTASGGRVKKLIHMYRRMAKTGLHFRGLSILQHKDMIGEICTTHRPVSLLDYGCGAAEAYLEPHFVHREWGIHDACMRLYDPAFKQFKTPPPEGAHFDGVLCSDVLEHIPESEVDEFVDRLFSHANLFVWASVCCRPAGKKMLDGSNPHVTLHELAWWHNVFFAAALRHPGPQFYLVETP